MKYLLIFSFLSMCYFGESQCCPHINNIEVIPTSPTVTDAIKIVTTVTTLYQGDFLQSSHSINGNNINIEACYYSGLLTATQTYYDTLDIGPLTAGTYTIDFIAHESSDTICNYADSSNSVMNFTVTDETNEVIPIGSEIGHIYPNPTSGSFIFELPDDFDVTSICIKTISGKIVHRGVYSKEIHVDIESGMYLIELLQNSRTLGHQRLLIL